MAAHDAGTVSLAEIRAKGLTLDVYEALAVVQAVCRDILDSDNPIPPARLDLDRIFISDDGTVTATAAAGQDEASGIQTIGRLLSQLLPSVDFLLLRPRVVAKATATPPGYSTLDEFSRALGTYQRPGGTETLKALYERWKKRSGAAPLVEFGGGEDRPPQSPATRNAVRIAIALLLLVSVGAGAHWLWTHRARFMSPAKTASAAPASDDAASGASTADGADPNHPTTAPSASATSSGTGAAPANGPRATPLRIGSPSSRSGGVRSASRPGTAPTAAAGGSRSTASGGGAAAAAPSTSVEHAAGGAPAESAGSGVAAIGTFETLSVYSNRNADVEPPTVIYPQRLVPVSGTTLPDRPAIEIVVNESGSVDSVKASAAPRTLGESVVLTSALSAAKSWRFRPALREGRPVKYRLLVTFSDR